MRNVARNGAPGRIRTCGLWLRSSMRYPGELLRLPCALSQNAGLLRRRPRVRVPSPQPFTHRSLRSRLRLAGRVTERTRRLSAEAPEARRRTSSRDPRHHGIRSFATFIESVLRIWRATHQEAQQDSMRRRLRARALGQTGVSFGHRRGWSRCNESGRHSLRC